MKDFTNREIKIGDIVAFHSSGQKQMFQGYVYNIGEKMICVEYLPYPNIGYLPYPHISTTYTKKHKVYPSQCIILESIDPVTSTNIKRTL